MPIARRNGILLDSSYDPESSARALASRMDTEGKAAAIIFGGGFGYLARELVRRGLRVLVIENDAELAVNGLRLLGEDAFRDFSMIFTDEPYIEALERDFLEPSWQIGDILIVSAAASAVRETTVGYPDLLQAERAVVALFKRRMQELETSAWFGERWTCNLLDNLCAIRGRSREQRADTRRGDWVIASPGPSLDAAVCALANSRGYYTLLALASALRPLLERGIRPDFVASTDGGWANGLHLAGLEDSGIPLLFPLFCYAGVARGWQGALIPFTYSTSVENFFLDAHSVIPVPESPTVALFAIFAAKRLGAERIIFAGQDFASISSKGHARGYRFDADAQNRGTRTAPPEKYLDATFRRHDEQCAYWRTDSKMRAYAEAFLREVTKSPDEFLALDTGVLSPHLAALPPARAFNPGGVHEVRLPPPALQYDRLERLYAALLRLPPGDEALCHTVFDDPDLREFFAFARPLAFHHYRHGAYPRADELLALRLPDFRRRILHRLRILLNTAV
ncbi:MAG: DUF115 domain-containing protein [Spirochaetota bacterium]|jgi:hypothetical protein|nr:DUF115 domain-containing protein [Spirochaetota bacterium]